MAVNGARGETAIEIEGRPRTLCLTLGALAEIETALGCQSLAELNTRMRALAAGDLLKVLAALLRGGGEGELAGRLSEAAVSPARAAAAVAEAFQRGLSET